MMFLKKNLVILICIVFRSPLFAAHGSYGKDFFEVAGWLVGIFFIWALFKIIKNGNAKNESDDGSEILDHFIEND